MNTQDLSKADLNLLISLQVLLEEKSVSRAAERLFITQPAMSKTLSRLRLLFNDPLFTRSSHGMRPTPRADELALDLTDILGGISHLFSGSRFDPATARDEVTIALSLPGTQDYSIDYVLVAHHRTDNSPLHNWLWEQITCTIRELRTTQPRKLRQRVAAGSAETKA